ncbi:MAG: hypothetical protein KDB00_22275 [Planctomycetales bacterium]|nr:hypothetical protein [Planctomycetales bacterium]
MIRIKIDRGDLQERIDRHDPGWIDAAKSKTDALEADPASEVASIWSPIKAVFMELQHSKCIFCEKEIENQPIEQDVEHFRPKNNVKPWKVPDWMKDGERITVSQPVTGSEPGYRLLAYNFLNYAAACKTCNSTRKRDYFPIAGSTRKCGAKNPARMKTEKAYLIYPISDIDDDPEDLIEFRGLSPQAKLTTGFGRKRALVTIELFRLDDTDERPYLFKKRAEKIWLLHLCLKQIEEGNAAERADARRVVDFLTSPQSEHTNCLRCFHKLCQEDPVEAESIAAAALALWTSVSP